MKLKRLLKPDKAPSSDQIILQSGKRLVMENCKKVIYCDTERISALGKVKVEICGRNLRLLELGNDNVEIRGQINSILLGDRS